MRSLLIFLCVSGFVHARSLHIFTELYITGLCLSLGVVGSGGILTRLPEVCTVDKSLFNFRHAKEIIASFKLVRPDESSNQRSTKREMEAFLSDIN